MNNEEQEQKNILAEKAKQAAKNQTKKVAKKVAKKAIKAAAKVAAKAILAVLKSAITFLLGLISPYLLVILGIVLLVIVIYVTTTLLFSFGDESQVGSEAYELRGYIEDKVYNSVDQSKPEQREYALPVELIISIMQVYGSKTETDMNTKDAIDLIVDKMSPTFTYDTVEGKKEQYTKTCDDDGCEKSKVKTTTFDVEYLAKVEAWDGTTTATMEGKWTPWESEVIKKTKKVKKTRYTRFYEYTRHEVKEENYNYYESILMGDPFNFKTADLKMIESFYQMTGGTMNYSSVNGDYSMVNMGYGLYDGNMNVIPGAGVPAEYMEFYLAGQERFKVDWYYLAAFHFVETKFSTHEPMISSVGAEGHTQFMPCTWMGWTYPGCKGSNGFVNAPTSVKEDPKVIKKYGGYGLDADNDGKASAWSLADSIMTTAYYLSRNGFSTNINKAIRAYNHSDSYVAQINEAAQKFKKEATYSSVGNANLSANNLGFVIPTVGRITSSWGSRTVGGDADVHRALDIANDLGTKIYAIADGTVTRVNTTCGYGSYGSTCGGGWGNYIRITHVINGVTYESIYAHLSKVNVAPKRKVGAGDVIGLMGSSGSSTGPHLHIELHSPRRAGPDGITNVLNPIFYLPPIPPS